MGKLAAHETDTHSRLASARQVHLCNLIRQYLREDCQIPTVGGTTDKLILTRLEQPYRTDQRAIEQNKGKIR